MNSLMFTFSGQQIGNQLSILSKFEQKQKKQFHKRPYSSKVPTKQSFPEQIFGKNQLFETFNMQSCILKKNGDKIITPNKINNSSLQIKQKKKLRNIVDKMIGKRFQMTKIDHKNIVCQLNQKKRKHNLEKFNIKLNQQNQQQQKNKQNLINCQNVFIQKQKIVDQFQQSKKRNLNPNNCTKLKKFQLSALRYANKLKIKSSKHILQTQVKDISDRVIISKSINEPMEQKYKMRSSSHTMINYPQSQNKLPYVFKVLGNRPNLSKSLQRRNYRISSAHVISGSRQKNDLQNNINSKELRCFNASKTSGNQFHPQSMISSCKKDINNRNKQVISGRFRQALAVPHKLLFQDDSSLIQKINKKIMDKTASNGKPRINSRIKTAHIQYAHRRLKQMDELINQNTKYQLQLKKNNFSFQSRQTAEQSGDFIDSNQKMNNTASFKNWSGQMMTCSIAFNMPKGQQKLHNL